MMKFAIFLIVFTVYLTKLSNAWPEQETLENGVYKRAVRYRPVVVVKPKPVVLVKPKPVVYYRGKRSLESKATHTDDKYMEKRGGGWAGSGHHSGHRHSGTQIGSNGAYNWYKYKRSIDDAKKSKRFAYTYYPWSFHTYKYSTDLSIRPYIYNPYRHRVFI